MGSTLVLTDVERLQKEAYSAIAKVRKNFVVFVSLNKIKQKTEDELKKYRVKTERIFFIECVSSESDEEVVFVNPKSLGEIQYAVSSFLKALGGDAVVIIDSLATLLIYNSINSVANFVQDLNVLCASLNVDVVAISQKTTGENLMEKIYNFFDKVEKK